MSNVKFQCKVLMSNFYLYDVCFCTSNLQLKYSSNILELYSFQLFRLNCFLNQFDSMWYSHSMFVELSDIRHSTYIWNLVLFTHTHTTFCICQFASDCVTNRNLYVNRHCQFDTKLENKRCLSNDAFSRGKSTSALVLMSETIKF